MSLKVHKNVTTDYNSPKHSLSGGSKQAMFIAYKNKPAGIALVPADDETRREFGDGTFRIAKGETNHMDGHVVKIDLKTAKLYFIDNEAYLNGDVKWQRPINLTKAILRNEADINKTYKTNGVVFE